MKIAQVAVVLVLLLVVAVALLAQTASSPAVTTLNLPVSGTVNDKCVPDVVTWSGSVQLVTSVWYDSNGGMHMLANEDFNANGVGTTGLTYIVTGGGASVSYSANVPPPQEMTMLVRMNVNGSGPVPNELERMLFELTIAANGNVNGTSQFLTPTCPGQP